MSNLYWLIHSVVSFGAIIVQIFQVPLILVRNLHKKYRRILQGKNRTRTVICGTSFAVDEGEILGLLGPNGAGKSTTLNIITGETSATSGTVSC
jgi:ABC-type multidrug transport system ATPase subunit